MIGNILFNAFTMKSLKGRIITSVGHQKKEIVQIKRDLSIEKGTESA